MNNSQKRELLITYLDIYLSKKGLLMKPVLKTIKNNLLTNKQISTKQYLSIIKFIEREPKFKRMDRDQIFEFFKPLVKGTNPEEPPNTLEPFFKENPCLRPIH